MTLSGLLGLEVRTETGQVLGRVFDVRARVTQRRLEVTGFVVGPLGLLERLGLGARRPKSSRSFVPWSAVRRADRRGVVVVAEPVLPN
jgi:sporulation protein YlmC with PRC-barrel domain